MDEIIQRIRQRLDTRCFGGDQDEKDVKALLGYLAKALFMLEQMDITDVDLDKMQFRAKAFGKWHGVWGANG